MKKLLVTLMSAVLCFSLFVFVGCGDSEQFIDKLEDKELGYEIPIYPDYEFDYKIIDEAHNNKEIILHVTDIKITLAAKNVIPANEPISGTFCKYTYRIKAHATTDPSNQGTRLMLWVGSRFSNETYYAPSSLVNEDGSIEWAGEIKVNYCETICFRSINLT